MYIENIDGPHKLEKQNLVTIIKGKRAYDILKCSKCGIEGKTHSLTTIGFKGSYSQEKVENCNNAAPAKIKVTECAAQGPAFENIKPGTTHAVVDPPEGHDNSRGIWVMGVGEPIKLLHGEYDSV